MLGFAAIRACQTSLRACLPSGMLCTLYSVKPSTSFGSIAGCSASAVQLGPYEAVCARVDRCCLPLFPQEAGGWQGQEGGVERRVAGAAGRHGACGGRSGHAAAAAAPVERQRREGARQLRAALTVQPVGRAAAQAPAGGQGCAVTRATDERLRRAVAQRQRAHCQGGVSAQRSGYVGRRCVPVVSGKVVHAS